MADGSFREDLYHRIAATTVRVPPLRDRREDIPALFMHYLCAERTLSVTADAMLQLVTWSWPGNVRELRNAARAAAAKLEVDATVVRRSHLPDAIRKAKPAPADDERQQICAALALTGGNVAEAARQLGRRRAGLYERLHILGIDPKPFRKR